MNSFSRNFAGYWFLPLVVIALPVSAADATPSSQTDADGAAKKYGEIVTVFEDRGILTSKGTIVIEPSLSFAQSTSTVVAIEGLTIIPALVIGLINVSQVQRDITTTAISFRGGITPRLEVGVKVPYLIIDESIRERKALDSSPVDIINDTHGHGFGDVEMTINYQINDGANGGPYYVANFRIKTDSGEGPFEIDRRMLQDQDGNDIGVVFAEQPTGSGFWAVQPGITMMFPSDPAVLYGSVSYLWNMEEDKGREFGGKIDPGDALGISFGIGFAVNEQTSFSLGYDHNVIFETDVEQDNDQLDATFDRIHSGSFLIGISQAVGKATNVNLSLGIGATENAPDMQLTLRVPFSF